MTKQFDGKVVLITGGTLGIGLASAKAFAREGAQVVIAGRRIAEGEAAVAEIAEQGGTSRFVQTDVSVEEQVVQVVRATVDAYGRLDCAVNCVGTTGKVGPLVDYTLAEWTQVVETNMTAMFLCLREQIKQLLAQGNGGFIVNVSSAIGKRSMPGLAAYGATKRGLESLIETAAQEYSSQGIIINGVAPGSIDTPMFAGFTNGGDPAIVKVMAENLHLVERIGKPEVVARVILSLCVGDPHDAFVAGATIPVDGGWIFRK